MSKTAKEWLLENARRLSRKAYELDIEYTVRLIAEEYSEMRVAEELEKITSIEDVIEDIERCAKEALEPYCESPKAKEKLERVEVVLKRDNDRTYHEWHQLHDELEEALRREHAYRKKALEWSCHGFRLQPGGLPKQCSRCFRLSGDAPYCHEVIKEVDSCFDEVLKDE